MKNNNINTRILFFFSRKDFNSRLEKKEFGTKNKFIFAIYTYIYIYIARI